MLAPIPIPTHRIPAPHHRATQVTGNRRHAPGGGSGAPSGAVRRAGELRTFDGDVTGRQNVPTPGLQELRRFVRRPREPVRISSAMAQKLAPSRSSCRHPNNSAQEDGGTDLHPRWRVADPVLRTWNLHLDVE